MTVKELIKQLKRMPQDLEVYTQDHDSSVYELSSKPSYVFLWVKEDVRPKKFPLIEDKECFETETEKCVSIRC